jgi:hypothetical protein
MRTTCEHQDVHSRHARVAELVGLDIAVVE